MDEIFVDDCDYLELNKYAWHLNEGYAVRNGRVSEDKKTIRMHRQIMGEPIEKVIDHINHNRLDNRRENLRVCTGGENAINRNIAIHNTSGVTGVEWDKRQEMWKANISKNNKRTHLGTFEFFDDAVKARKDAEIKYFGEFQNKNIQTPKDKIAKNKKKSGQKKTRGVVGIQGISWSNSRKVWISVIRVDGHRKYLGSYKNIHNAISAVKEAEIKYFNDFTDIYLRIDEEKIRKLELINCFESEPMCISDKQTPSGVIREIGVVWNKTKEKWDARTVVNGKITRVGTYVNIEDANEAVRKNRDTVKEYSDKETA